MRYLPLARGAFRIGSPFGPRDGGFHAGQDFAADDGTPFYAVADGTVQFIGAAGGYGQWIVIDHPSEVGGGCSEYGHMWDAFATGLNVGDRVRGGQHIGFVGSNGQSTGPHLHLSVMPAGYDPNNKIDPMPWLGDGAYPEEGHPVPQTETAYGIDVSNHQGNFDFAQARAEGFTFATHKISESFNYRDPLWPRARDEMSRHFPGRWGGYVFCRRAAAPEREAENLATHAGPLDFPLQIDYEDTDGGGSLDDLWARYNAYRAVGFTRFLPVYIPRWFWRDRMGSPDLTGFPLEIWNSHYVTGTGFASSLYTSNDGDNHPGWAPVGNKPVAILQFTEKAQVAGQQIDANAVRGGEPRVAELFSDGEELDMDAVKHIEDFITGYIGPGLSDVKDVREQLCGQGQRDSGQYGGWPQLGDPETAARTMVDGQAVMLELLYSIEKRLAVLEAKD